MLHDIPLGPEALLHFRMPDTGIFTSQSINGRNTDVLRASLQTGGRAVYTLHHDDAAAVRLVLSFNTRRLHRLKAGAVSLSGTTGTVVRNLESPPAFIVTWRQGCDLLIYIPLGGAEKLVDFPHANKARRFSILRCPLGGKPPASPWPHAHLAAMRREGAPRGLLN